MGVSLSPCACYHDLFDMLVSHLEISENISIFRDTFPNMGMWFHLYQHSMVEQDLDVYLIYQNPRGEISESASGTVH